jgi:hypothetical protein
MNVPVFDTAALMYQYTGNKVHKRHASLKYARNAGFELAVYR